MMKPLYYVTRWYVDPDREEWPDGIRCVDYNSNYNIRDGRTHWVVLRVERPMTEAADEFFDLYLRDESGTLVEDVQEFDTRREASAEADDHSLGQFLGLRH